jgi:hypothetical protein
MDVVSNLTFQSKTVTKFKPYQIEAARNLYPRYTIHISKNYKINSPKFAEILNERSKADDVTHAPGVATTSAWRCGKRRIAPKHHEELRLWLGEKKEEEEDEVEEEEEEEERRNRRRALGTK